MGGLLERQWQAERDAALDAEIARNTRLMLLAEHLGFVSELRDYYAESHVWLVPAELRAKVGCMGAVVRP
jgi:sulfur relay (sulfurtransferase) DsrC/TusE family protein